MIDERGSPVPVRTDVAAALAPFVAALHQDPAALRVREALSLVEGFELQIVVAPSPRVGSAFLVWLDAELPKCRGDAARLVRVSPYPLGSSSALTAVTPEGLGDPVLSVATSGTGGSDRIVLIDASAAPTAHRDVWIRLFQSLNERRNVLAESLRCPLCLCISPDLEVELIHAAPDMWSVRSVAVTLQEPVLPGEPARPSQDFVSEGPSSDVSVEELDLDRARELAASGEPAALRALAVLLSRQAASDEKRGDRERALAEYREMLQAATRADAGSLRVRALNSMADLMVELGDPNGALAILQEQVLPYAERTSDERLRLVTQGRRVKVLQALGRPDDALALLEQQLPILKQMNEEHAYAVASMSLAYLLRNRGRLDEALNLLREALPIFERNNDSRSLAAASGEIGKALARRGQLEDALVHCTKALGSFERLGDVRAAARAKSDVGDVLHAMKRFDQALKMREEAAQAFERLGDRELGAHERALAGSALLAMRRVDEALACFRTAEAAFRAAGNAQGRGAALLGIAKVLIERHEWHEALSALRDATASLQQGGNKDLLPYAHRLKGLAHARMRELDEASTEFQTALALSRDIGDAHDHAYVLGELAAVKKLRGEREEALKLYREQSAEFERIGDLGSSAAALGKLADLLMSRGELEEAERVRRREQASYERAGETAAALRSKLALADLWLTRGDVEDRRRAAVALKEILGAAESLGSPEREQLHSAATNKLIAANAHDESR